jgi:exonuclease SbcC
LSPADVEFGPGLNVLYGPNDLGKSSLAWAIRAVLLLQHNSVHSERFVSWYGGGEPRVSLTFLDADNRYWRVTKTFGGSAGRSALEASKDGRTFSAEASGRQVDEKLRGLLGWGVPAPATGGARGFPDSFLAQVLLSEQDNVRKVLFDTSLATDGDESGRNRLTEALGALAQDPMFKKVLDDAQTNVDRAFTAKGRKKTAAGSPFIEIAGRIKTMQAEHDELEAKVRNTIAAEARIRELIELRDVTSRELEEARRVFSQYQARLVVAKRRRALQAQIEEHRAKLQTGETLQRDIEQEQAVVDDLQKKAALGATHQKELTALAAQHGAAKDAARQKLDTITLDDGASDRRRRELQEQLGATQEQLQDAERGLDRATEAKRAAKGRRR